jgi:hypothetical protein
MLFTAALAAAPLGFTEKPVLAPNGKWTNTVFSKVVGYGTVTILKIILQLFLLVRA